jgi:hypothetical protein
VLACGAGGETCATCVGPQTCTAAACSQGPGTDGGSDAGQAHDIDSLCQDFATAVCDFTTRCGYTSGVASCQQVFGAALVDEGCFYREKQAVRRGRATFDQAGATQCFAALEGSAPCFVSSMGAVPGCPEGAFSRAQGFITGTVAQGDYCYLSEECGAGTYCTADTSAICPGTCQPFLATGATTVSSVACAPGDYDFSGKCSPYAADQSSCAGGHTCVGTDSCRSSGLCEPIGDAGGPCSASDDCNELLTCPPSTELCTAPQVLDAGCAKVPCQFDLICLPAFVDGGSPACRPPGEAASPCLTSSDCAVDFYCSGATATTFGACTAEVGEGADCTTVPCDSFLYCTTANTCAVRGQLGALCDPFAPASCAPPWSCEADGGNDQCLPQAGLCVDTAI